MTKTEQAAMEIIASAGEAKSDFLEAIDHAEALHFDEAHACMKAGKKCYLEAHEVHAGLLADQTMELSLLMVHAEDQLMAAEEMELLAEKFIVLYQKMKA